MSISIELSSYNFNFRFGHNFSYRSSNADNKSMAATRGVLKVVQWVNSWTQLSAAGR